jgi:hypothetical protein
MDPDMVSGPDRPGTHKANKEQPTITRAEPLTEDVAQDMVHNEVLNRMADARAARMQKKLGRFAKLTSQAF